MDNNLVSVIMPVYNGEKYLPAAIESILNQSYRNFEFIIIDGASTDGTCRIIKKYHDSRIIFLSNRKHMSIAASLNQGIKIAKGELIARMDADDISRADRFEKQVNFLRRHSEVGVVGSWVDYINASGERTGSWHTPTSPAFAAWQMYFGPPIANPVAMIRRKILVDAGGYGHVKHVEDYRFWAKIRLKAKISNLKEVLLQRRVLKESLYHRTMTISEKIVQKIIVSLVTQDAGVKIFPRMAAALRSPSVAGKNLSLKEKEQAADVLEKLQKSLCHRLRLNLWERRIIDKDRRARLKELLGE